MAVKLKLGNPTKPGARAHPILRFFLLAALACLFLGACVFGAFYLKYQHIVDDRLASGPIFANVSQVYAAPREVRVGQHLTVNFIAQDLRAAGYNANPDLGTFTLSGSSIAIKPGPQSYHSTDGATITTGLSSAPTSDATTDAATSSAPSNATDTVVQSITADNGAPLAAYQLEPQLITALSEDKNRTKRRIVTYEEIPPNMRNAVLAIEDRRFFEHGGVNYVRTARCVVQDILAGRKECGGSTLTQQLARGFFLTPDKTIARKIAELMITYQIEARFNKQQIFTMYANEVNIGQRGSFAINGFGEAAQAFFGRDLGHLDLAQCALIAGLIQTPSYRNPYTHPDRAIARRNVVLDAMVDTEAITHDQADRAKAEPLRLAPPNIDASEAPYFVDLVHDALEKRIGDQGVHESLRIYTSLDPELQRAAAESVDEGMKNVDSLVRRRHKRNDTDITYPQVALVAINPHTGQVLALVGGRNYGISQLNHAISERPTGSVFKPFVYATAYNTSLDGVNIDGNGPFTALTRLNDDTQDFGSNGQSYMPGNMVKGEYPGMVPAAQALAHSLNIATISLAQMTGYENVAALARSAGIVNARGTPSVAIGTYNATPIDIAGAYTVFANSGVREQPWLLASVRNANGDIVADFAPTGKQILDPRVAFLTQSLLQGVVTYGTGAGVHAHGFNAPIAGKTGTEHDAWFAGYSSNLLCVIWIGNDDYTDIKLQGADAAAPIWADFMQRAQKLAQYSDMKPFVAPSGVSTIPIDRATWLPADATCPEDYDYAFLDGTIPGSTCSHMGQNPQAVMQGLFSNTSPNAATAPASTPQQAPNPQSPEPPEKKKNIFQKIFGGGNDDKPKPQPPPTTPPQ
ncbi:MAG: transglycosylase domain-containing protein [Acidobacteriaceae bacterium]|jgi:penicillin-binding protein 1B